MSRQSNLQPIIGNRFQGTAHEKTLQRTNFFSKRELAELPNVLVPNEEVLAIISGTYIAGTAILCATSHRVLLIDKKMIRLSLEDIRYESIREVHYSRQPIMASIHLYYAGREMQFKTWYKNDLRVLSRLVQEKMFKVGEQHTEASRGDVDYDLSHQKSGSGDPLQQANNPRAQLEPLELLKSQKQAVASSKPAIGRSLALQAQRLRVANSFVDRLRMSTKAGRQVVELEIASALRFSRTSVSRR